jgi:hypothetical protein
MNENPTQSLGKAVETAEVAAEATVRRPVIRKLARFGFLAKGVLFIVVGALAVMLSSGLPDGRIADPTGALAVIARQSLGRALLLLFIVGAVGHGVWNLLRGIADIDDARRNWLGILRRSIAVGIGVFYVGLALTALEIVLAARVTEGPSQAEETLVFVLLGIPFFGALLVFLIGLGVIGAGLFECYNGVSGRFRGVYRTWEISAPHMVFIMVLGVLSFTARAVILMIIGYYFVTAAVWDGPNGSIGLDAALFALAENAYGRVFLFAAGIGLFAHGVLAFYEAKYRRIS